MLPSLSKKNKITVEEYFYDAAKTKLRNRETYRWKEESTWKKYLNELKTLTTNSETKPVGELIMDEGWYENGNKAYKFQYSEGKEDGCQYYWNEKGETIYRHFCKNGKKNFNYFPELI